ncbi:unnamed protein product, partial [Sphacelaria rigidula]
FTGVRVFWLSQTFALRTAFSAVKLFRPIPELSDESRLSDVLLLWVREVLSEYDLGESDRFGTVTDAASDVRRLCVKVMKVSWEWCMPHMLNRALVEAFGTTVARAASKNTEAREVIDTIKKTVEYLNKYSSM